MNGEWVFGTFLWAFEDSDMGSHNVRAMIRKSYCTGCKWNRGRDHQDQGPRTHVMGEGQGTACYGFFFLLSLSLSLSLLLTCSLAHLLGSVLLPRGGGGRVQGGEHLLSGDESSEQ